MKKNILFFTTIIILCLSGHSQFINYEKDYGWNFGFNMGGSWQRQEAFINQNDTTFTKPYAGFSGGFTFGKAIYEKEGKFFAFDLRFRYLKGKNFGWTAVTDSFASPNGVYGMPFSNDSVFAYHNYKMKLNEFDLELVLTLNKLREKTGIILYGFGGVGLTYYNVNRDILNGSSSFNTGELYDYASISTGVSDQEISRQLRNLSDLHFETEIVDDQLKFMPSLGLGLGYQLNDWVSVGIEHKITYALHNNLDGISSDLKNDNFHYTAIKLGVNLFGDGNSSGGSSYNHNDYSTEQTATSNSSQTISNSTNEQQNNNNINLPQGNPPLVNITNPANNNTIVHNSLFHLNAKVYYVSGAQDIQVLHNGFLITDFSFNVNTNELKANLSLSPGENIIEIIAANNYGSDHDDREIIYELPEVVEIPPVVVINHPHNTPHEAENKEIIITANILNIETASQVEFKVNGISHTYFNFNPATDAFTSAILLEEGVNNIIITATNNAGSSNDFKSIIYKKETPPVVEITSPSVSPTTINVSLINIKGKVLNVPSKSNITVRLNGYNVGNFMYNINTKEIAFSVNLINGQNIVEISANNSAGTASDISKIIYKTPEITHPPVVSYIQPATAPLQVEVSNVTIIAQVLNVSNKSQTLVGFNGSNINGYSYNSVTKLLTVNLNLNEGSNSLKVSGTNQAGSDVKELNIIYTIPQQIEMPKITIIEPNTNPFSTSVNTHTVSGLIEHVEIASNAKATINNQPVSNFTFDPQTDKFVSNVTLNEGANIFEVDAVNSAGAASKATTLIYVPVECVKPTITLISPNNSQTNTTNSKGYLEMQISNEETLVFIINGEEVPSYNFESGKFSSYLHLIEGVNNYEVIAINECGSTSQKVSIIYEKEIPCSEPVINFIKPLGTGVAIPVTTSRNYHLAINFLEISLKGEIVITHNGKVIPFNYDQSSGEAQANVMLSDGMNTFEVIAKNNCGEVSKTAQIKLENPLLPPVVKLTQPTSFPYQTQNDQVDVFGKVINVENKNDIHVYLDGQPINFSFNTATGVVTIQAQLQMGGNQLIVEAENKAGSDQANAELIKLGIPPKIHLTNRSENTTAKQPEYVQINSRIAIIGYVSNFENVEFIADLNGSPFSFNYNSSNGTFRGSVNINDGELLKFTIKAINKWGTDTQMLYLSKESSNNNSGNSGSENNNRNGSGSNSKNNPSNNTNTKTSSSSSAQEQQINSEYQKLINKANMYYNAKKWTEAKSYYNKALQLKPTDSYSKSRLSNIDKKLKLIEQNKSKLKPTGGSNKDIKVNQNKDNTVKPTNNSNQIKTNDSDNESEQPSKSNQNTKLNSSRSKVGTKINNKTDGGN